MSETLGNQSESVPAGSAGSFTVRLHNFEGPFDLLLQLISKHKLDITEVALSVVTDEFIAHVKAMGADWELDATSSFVVVAATLLDLKTARLLPQGDVEDIEDLELLEARDLLFARLLQYRAFKVIAGWLGETLSIQQRRFARPGGLEERFARLRPDIEIGVSPQQFAAIAVGAMSPKEVAKISLGHLHRPTVSVRDEAARMVSVLKTAGQLSFRELCADAATVVVVARFLALLELFRERAVSFEQLVPLGELVVRWRAGDVEHVEISDDFEPEATP